jgi:aspartyl-tRNA(Asn)/glutamyl-tRNA(Gln) amidotransferase subunit A
MTTRKSIVEQLSAGDLSSFELTETYLERIARLNPGLSSFITVTADGARREAREADAARTRGVSLGPLHGLPVALKDNIDTAGVVTTMGSALYRTHRPATDADVVRRLRDAGAVVLGKLNLHEFAYGTTTQNPHFGDCRNPWDRMRVPGGSSGGAGVAVAAQLCAAAIGTDTGGSIRIPAALTGVSGLRPTAGRVSNRGVFPVSWSFDTVGPVARHVDDLAHVFAVLAGLDLSGDGPNSDGPSLSLAAPDVGIEDIRIGVPDRYFRAASADIKAAVRLSADTLARAGARLVEVETPGAEEALEAARTIISAEAYAVHRAELSARSADYGDDVRERLTKGEAILGADYAEARETGRRWRRSLEAVFEDVDLLLVPTTLTTAPLATAVETIGLTAPLTELTYPWSLARLPVLALPSGFDRRELPIGIQLVGSSFREDTLFRAGRAYQHVTEWHLREPPLSRVSTPTGTDDASGFYIE